MLYLQAVKVGLRLNFMKDVIVEIVNLMITNKNIRYEKKVFLRNENFSTPPLYAIEKTRERLFPILKLNFETISDMINKMQSIKDKTELKYWQKICDCFDQVKDITQSGHFQFGEDPFSKNVQSLAFLLNEALLLINCLQVKPQERIRNKNYNDLYYTISSYLSPGGEK